MIGSFPRKPESEVGLLGLAKGVLEKKKLENFRPVEKRLPF